MIDISIAMATYNGAAYLEEQLDSLARQTLPPSELVVSDDASTDRTLDILEAFEAPFPITVHRNSRRLGYGENFLRAARQCSGEWIAFCDQDDVWLDNKLEWCAGQIDNDVNLIAHNAIITDESLKPAGKLYDYPASAFYGPWELPPEWHCGGMTQVFRASLLQTPSDRRVSFPGHPHKNAHDIWIALIANAKGGILTSDLPLVLYRRHEATVTEMQSPQSMAFKNNGGDYALRAQHLTGVAELLSSLGIDARKVADQAALLKLRSEAYLRPSLLRRGHALAKLISSGGYFGGGAWPFGGRRMVKDLIFALLLN